MLKKISVIVLVILSVQVSFSQKQKVQSAWRALNDYQTTLKDNKPDMTYLNKAQEAIDLAAANEETKANAKMLSYKTQIYYELFKYNLKTEDDKLAESISDKNLRRETAYGNVSAAEFEVAVKSMIDLQKNTKDQDLLQEVMTINLQMVSDVNNLAIGRYKAKKYDEAADFFESAYHMNTNMNGGKKDTASLFNAGISAQKAKNYKKAALINQKMIDENIASAQTYQYLYNSKMNIGDSLGAIETVKQGRKAYPNDLTLLNFETDYYLQKGMQQESLDNLQKALQKDPGNAVLYLVTGNIYDNMANPKGKSGKDTTKPANFDELFAKAEEYYKKAVDLKPTNQDYYFNALYNLGALYNNYGGYLSNEMSKLKITDLAKSQKIYQAKIDENYKKAIPYLEQALIVKPNDISTATALRKLYLLTNNETKANEMNLIIKGGK